MHYTWKNIKKSYKNNKFKTSAQISNEEFELTDASCSISDIQGYLEYILKNQGYKINDNNNNNNDNNNNTSIRTFSNKIKNSFPYKIKAGYYPELLTPETMELLESTESNIKKS